MNFKDGFLKVVFCASTKSREAGAPSNYARPRECGSERIVWRFKIGSVAGMSHTKTKVTLDDIRRAVGRNYTVAVAENPYYNDQHERKVWTWEKLIESAKSYLVGKDVPTKKFIREHTSRLTTWQSLAALWAIENPSQQLIIETSDWVRAPRRCYVICARTFGDRNGGVVEIGLPHHDAGGERHWISRDCKTRVLVNVD